MEVKSSPRELMPIIVAYQYRTMFPPPSWQGSAPWPPIARFLEVYPFTDGAIDLWADKIEEENAKGRGFLLICRDESLWALASTKLVAELNVRAARREASRRTGRGEVSS